ncbi:MAG: acetyltransferase [Planctomycetota bacterium]
MQTNDANTTNGLKPAVVLGAGGHAGVLLSLLKLKRQPILAVLDDDPSLRGKPVPGTSVRVAGGLDDVDQYPAEETTLINAIGSTRRPTTRKAVYERMISKGYTFQTLIHESAVIAPEVRIHEGVQIMARATIQPGVTLHPNCLINTSASIDHDTHIGPHTHIAPGVTICGRVAIGNSCHIGAGATVIQGISIADSAVIGAGATVINDIHVGQIMIGTPAKPID